MCKHVHLRKVRQHELWPNSKADSGVQSSSKFDWNVFIYLCMRVRRSYNTSYDQIVKLMEEYDVDKTGNLNKQVCAECQIFFHIFYCIVV